MTDRKHTELPWSACHDGECSCFSINSKHHPIATVEHRMWGDSFPTIEYHTNGVPYIDMNFMEYGEIPDDEARENWKFIARACNVHYELLEALEAAVSWRGLDGDGISDPVRTQLYDAIAKAKGE